MRVLVAHASKHGATARIAERIGETLTHAGHEGTVRTIRTAGDPGGYDAAVVGSAVYLGHWLKDAKAYLRQQQQALVRLPVWLFSSGPIGAAEVDQEGNDLRQASAPQELEELLTFVHPRDHRVFFGALDPKHLTLAERALRILPAGRDLLPEGDFRNWEEIDDWAAHIAAELQQP